MTNTDMVQCRGCEQWYFYGTQHACTLQINHPYYSITNISDKQKLDEIVKFANDITNRLKEDGYAEIDGLEFHSNNEINGFFRKFAKEINYIYSKE